MKVVAPRPALPAGVWIVGFHRVVCRSSLDLRPPSAVSLRRELKEACL
jgi:hypothetical protein